MLARSRRSNFEGNNKSGDASVEKIRILYEYERLVHFSRSPHSHALPAEWTKICLKAPNIVRNKVNTEGAKILESAYTWLKDDNNNNNNNPLHATNQHHVKFQRNLSFDDQQGSRQGSVAAMARLTLDAAAKRSPLMHSKSVCD